MFRSCAPPSLEYLYDLVFIAQAPLFYIVFFPQGYSLFILILTVCYELVLLLLQNKRKFYRNCSPFIPFFLCLRDSKDFSAPSTFQVFSFPNFKHLFPLVSSPSGKLKIDSSV